MENREYLCLFTRPAMSLQQMCLGRNLLSIILYLLSITLAGAYTVEWALPPVYYPSIIRCAPGIFQVASSTASHVVDIKANKSLFKGENGQVFSNELDLHIGWPKYWSFSFSINSSNEYPGLISFRID